MEIFLGIVFSIAVFFPMIAVGISGILDNLPSVKQARIDADELRSKAKQDAKNIVDEANKKSEEILSTAKSKAEKNIEESKIILSGAKNDAEKILNEAKMKSKEAEEKLSQANELEELKAKCKSEIARYQKLSFEFYQSINEKSNLQNLLSEALKDFSSKNIIFNVEDYLYSVSIGRLGNMINSDFDVRKLYVNASIQSGPKNYHTTLNTCNCEDFLLHRKPCKHMFYLTYNFGLLYAQKDNIEKQLKSSILKLKEKIKEEEKTINKLKAAEKRIQNKKALPKQS